jgi:hypothetical protein
MADSPKSALIGICFTAKKKIELKKDEVLQKAKSLIMSSLGKDWETTYLNLSQDIFIAKSKKVNDTLLQDMVFEAEMWKLALKISKEDKEGFIDYGPIPFFELYKIDSGFINPCKPDPTLPYDWHLKNYQATDIVDKDGNKTKIGYENNFSIELERAWGLKSPTGFDKGDGIRIGHFDCGYSTHFELFDNPNFLYRSGIRNKIIGKSNWDVVFNIDGTSSDAIDTHDFLGDSSGHGTSTAGLIIGGNHPNSVVMGVAPKAQLIPVNTSNFVIITPLKLIEAIDHAIQNRCHVLSISLGWINGLDTTLVDIALIQAVMEYGIIPVAAAAQPNLGFNLLGAYSYPGRSPWVVSCGAYDALGVPWEQNVSGSHIRVSAPGVGVFNPKYHFTDRPIGLHSVSQGCGTSYSAAITAGAVANWLSFCGRDELIERYGKNLLAPFLYDFYHTCYDKKNDGTYQVRKDWEAYEGKGQGFGRLNLYRLLERRSKKDNWPEAAVVTKFFNEKLGFNPIEQMLENFFKELKVEYVLAKLTITLLLGIVWAVLGFEIILSIFLLLVYLKTYHANATVFSLIAMENNVAKKKLLRSKLIEQLKEQKAPLELIDVISNQK